MIHQAPRRAALTVAIILAGTTLTGCGTSFSQQALAEATKATRYYADKTAQTLQRLLRSGRPRAGIDDISIVDATPPDAAFPVVFGHDLSTDGVVTLEVALHAGSNTIGASAAVRMCVRLTGEISPTTTVTVSDTPCSANLPLRNEGVGAVVTVVHY